MPLIHESIHTQASIAKVIAMTLISTSLASEEFQFSLAGECFRALYVLLAKQSSPCAYNVSSHLVSSTKGTFKESWSARKTTQVSIADSKLA